MNMRWMRMTFLGCLMAALTCSCARLQTRMMKTELQEVAKRWCLTIRASQAIPVYPLTEDLQPGDVFLVQTPVPQQAREYTRRGYLPLDFHLYRLEGLDYQRFYQDAYFRGNYGADFPHDRPEPSSEPGGPRFNLAPLPASAFPDYTFTSKKGMGTRLAIPVNGVPLGLSFLGSSDVQGSVKMSDAYTYGVDDLQLLQSLRAWAAAPEVRLELAGIRSRTREPLYLRVVSRVFLVGRIMVSLQAQGASSAGADVGKAQPLNPLSMSAKEADELESVAESYREAANILSQALNEGLPGGSVRFASANRSSVVMEEKLERLLVLGYLGFDVEVDSHGRLGPPVATLDLLEDRSGAHKRLMAGLSTQGRDVAERQVREIFDAILGDPENTGEPFDSIRAHLNAFANGLAIPDDLPVYEAPASGPERVSDMQSHLNGKEGFERYAAYRSALNNSLDALQVEKLPADLVADRERLEAASAELIEAFETSRHVAEALSLYYEEALLQPK